MTEKADTSRRTPRCGGSYLRDPETGKLSARAATSASGEDASTKGAAPTRTAAATQPGKPSSRSSKGESK